MQLFVSEYLCSGAWPEPVLDGSLAREGRAMLLAVLEDFSSILSVQVTTTWDQRLGPPPTNDAEVQLVSHPEQEWRLFADLTARADAVYLIAPEFDQILETRTRFAENADKLVLGSRADAINLSADKLQLAGHFKQHGIPTIETCEWDSLTKVPYPAVVKPRFGAGSQETYQLATTAAAKELIENLGEQSLLHQAVIQPFVAGQALSVGIIVNEDGSCAHIFPPAEQLLSTDGRFQYLGGRVPATAVDITEVQATARQACRSVPGLRGYVGVDLIVPDESPHIPLVVEINPRLTTSYLGYRRHTDNNLAARLLPGENQSSPIRWKTESVAFTADEGQQGRLPTGMIQ